MVVIKAFKWLRPPKEIVKNLASRPYDVLDSNEARKEADGNQYSLLHIIKPDIDLPIDVDLHDQIVYDKAKENLELFKNKWWLKSDEKDCLYIYAQTMWDRTQYGLVACASVQDYMNWNIKKHELTRKDKEEDRMKHVRITNANMEPVFFAYPAKKELDDLIENIVKNNDPEYDFVADLDGFGHQFRVISDDEMINKIIQLFAEMPATYVADWHHRTAAAALVGNEKKNNNPDHRWNEEYNYFLAVHFPDDQLYIMDYNRVVKDLNWIQESEFIESLKEDFDIEDKWESEYKPVKLHEFSMYLWWKRYALTAKTWRYNDQDPIWVLDVTILSNLVLDKLLDIKDLRTDKRIDFVGWLRWLGELKRRVDNWEMKVAFALYPVSMKQLIDIADTWNIMPPKTTWFEPKLRSGLVIHELE